MFAAGSSKALRSTQTVLITGCSSGIGRHAALRLSQMGYRVLATARKPEDLEALKDSGLKALHLELRSEKSVESCCEQVLDFAEGKLYALFNNAAYGQIGALEDLGRGDLRAQFEANFFGWHDLTCRMIPAMRAQQSGRIVLNSSVLGYTAFMMRGAYVATKHALEGWADTLRQELRNTGIFVTLIEPGPIHSNFNKNAMLSLDHAIDTKSSPHILRYQMMERKFREKSAPVPFTLPPDAVTRVLLRCLSAKRPKCRYRVTVPSHVLWWLKPFLSDRMLDNLLYRLASI